jgi:putative addiction module component (TIGR02574 family)
MPLTIEQIVEETKQMPADVVADLVDRIWAAKYGVEDAALSPAWRATLDRRVKEIRSGKEQGIPGEVISARIRQIVGR